MVGEDSLERCWFLMPIGRVGVSGGNCGPGTNENGERFGCENVGVGAPDVNRDDDGRCPIFAGVFRRSCELRDGVRDLEAPTLSMLTSAVAALGAAIPKPRLPRLMWRVNLGGLTGDEALGGGLLTSKLMLLRLGGGITSGFSEPGR
jgi:hypothetical protein